LEEFSAPEESAAGGSLGPDVQNRKLDNPATGPENAKFFDVSENGRQNDKGWTVFAELCRTGLRCCTTSYHVMGRAGTIFIAQLMGLAAILLWRGKLYRDEVDAVAAE